jgi:hypothetical protein
MGYGQKEQTIQFFYGLGGLNIPPHVGNVNIFTAVLLIFCETDCELYPTRNITITLYEQKYIIWKLASRAVYNKADCWGSFRALIVMFCCFG